MSKFTEEFSRTEMNWFYRHLQAEQDKAMKKINSMKGGEKVLSNTQHDELAKLNSFSEELSRFIVLVGDVRANSDRAKHAILLQKEILEEAIELIDINDQSLEADRKRLDAAAEMQNISVALSNAEKIKLTLDRPVIKFVLKLLERDLHNFRSAIIPNYEKSSPDDYKDAPSYMQKEYWVAKAIKSKEILEVFKRKLEKGL